MGQLQKRICIHNRRRSTKTKYASPRYFEVAFLDDLLAPMKMEIPQPDTDTERHLAADFRSQTSGVRNSTYIRTPPEGCSFIAGNNIQMKRKKQTRNKDALTKLKEEN
jgi:hypothetical protein